MSTLVAADVDFAVGPNSISIKNKQQVGGESIPRETFVLDVNGRSVVSNVLNVFTTASATPTIPTTTPDGKTLYRVIVIDHSNPITGAILLPPGWVNTSSGVANAWKEPVMITVVNGTAGACAWDTTDTVSYVFGGVGLATRVNATTAGQARNMIWIPFAEGVYASTSNGYTAIPSGAVQPGQTPGRWVEIN